MAGTDFGYIEISDFDVTPKTAIVNGFLLDGTTGATMHVLDDQRATAYIDSIRRVGERANAVRTTLMKNGVPVHPGAVVSGTSSGVMEIPLFQYATDVEDFLNSNVISEKDIKGVLPEGSPELVPTPNTDIASPIQFNLRGPSGVTFSPASAGFRVKSVGPVGDKDHRIALSGFLAQDVSVTIPGRGTVRLPPGFRMVSVLKGSIPAPPAPAPSVAVAPAPAPAPSVAVAPAPAPVPSVAVAPAPAPVPSVAVAPAVGEEPTTVTHTPPVTPEVLTPPLPTTLDVTPTFPVREPEPTTIKELDDQESALTPPNVPSVRELRSISMPEIPEMPQVPNEPLQVLPSHELPPVPTLECVNLYSLIARLTGKTDEISVELRRIAEEEYAHLGCSTYFPDRYPGLDNMPLPPTLTPERQSATAEYQQGTDRLVEILSELRAHSTKPLTKEDRDTLEALSPQLETLLLPSPDTPSDVITYLQQQIQSNYNNLVHPGTPLSIVETTKAPHASYFPVNTPGPSPHAPPPATMYEAQYASPKATFQPHQVDLNEQASMSALPGSVQQTPGASIPPTPTYHESPPVAVMHVVDSPKVEFEPQHPHRDALPVHEPVQKCGENDYISGTISDNFPTELWTRLHSFVNEHAMVQTEGFAGHREKIEQYGQSILGTDRNKSYTLFFPTQTSEGMWTRFGPSCQPGDEISVKIDTSTHTADVSVQKGGALMTFTFRVAVGTSKASPAKPANTRKNGSSRRKTFKKQKRNVGSK